MDKNYADCALPSAFAQQAVATTKSAMISMRIISLSLSCFRLSLILIRFYRAGEMKRAGSRRRSST